MNLYVAKTQMYIINGDFRGNRYTKGVALAPLIIDKFRRGILAGCHYQALVGSILDRFFFTRKHLMYQNSSLGKTQNPKCIIGDLVDRVNFVGAADGLFWFTEGRFFTLTELR